MYEYDMRSRKNLQESWCPNIWDILAFSIVFLAILLIVNALKNMASPPLDLGKDHIMLDWLSLFHYALYSVVRMLIALLFSLLATFLLGTLAARSAFWERIIIPLVDILQSVPILGYLSLAATFFERLFPGQGIGFEFVALFAIFTSQVWNMILSFYQSLRMVPKHMNEAASVMQLTNLQRFWRIDVPYAMPDLLMNIMVSLSAGWFYVVESEAIELMHNQTVLLPGIGSYISVANDRGDTEALVAAVGVMFLVIVAYDQLIFRPLSHIVRAYQADDEEQLSRSWLVNIVSRTRFFKICMSFVRTMFSYMLLWSIPYSRRVSSPDNEKSALLLGIGQLLLLLACLTGVWFLANAHIEFVISWDRLLYFLYVGLWTMARIVVLLLICVMVWVPIGVWIGFRPWLADFMMPVVQFVAAFPPNLFYPLIMEFILVYGLNVEIWCAPLLILGTQWYILFNVISAVRAIPKDVLFAVRSLRLRGWMLWQRLIFPAIAPHLVTGAMAAAGGAWNACIAAEVLTWKGQVVSATGLGSVIRHAAVNGNVEEHVWAIAVMCLYVFLINRLFWNPLYRYVVQHYDNG